MGAAPVPCADDVARRSDFRTVLDLLPGSEEAALLGADGRRPATHRELRDFVRAGLPPLLGAAPAERVCVAVPPGPEGAAALLVLSVRCCYCPLAPTLAAGEAQWALGELRPRALCAAPGAAAALRQAAAGLSIPVFDILPHPEVGGLFSLSGPALPAPPDGAEQRMLGRHDVCAALHTSGTTRRPKLVQLTQQSMCCGALCVAQTLELRPADRCMCVMPLYHWHGLGACVLPSLIAGSSVVCTPFRDGGAFFAAVRATAATWYSAAPTIHLQVLSSAEQGAAAGHGLRLVRNCSAALLPCVGERLRRALAPAVVLPTYAMTESLPICSNPLRGEVKLGSVGPPAGPSVRIAAPGEGAGEEPQWLPAGEAGEVCVRGACVTSGYAEGGGFYPGGWLRTGDLGHLDADGYLHLSGRLKELVNRAGEKISPVFIEDAVARHPGVASVIAFAAPHEALGEAVGVVCVPREQPPPGLGELRRFAAAQGAVEAKWLPECVVWCDAIPAGPTGKPQRIGLSGRFGLPPLPAAQAEWSARWTDAGWALTALDSAPPPRAAPGSGTAERVRAAALRVMRVAALPSDEAGLMESGLDSITAVVLADDLAAEFGAALPPSFLDTHRSVAAIAAAIDAAGGEGGRARGGPKGAADGSAPAAGCALAALQAAREGDRAALRRLAAEHGWGAVVGARDKHGLTALQWAAGGGHQECCELLLDADPPAGVDEGNKEGRTPLMWACRNGHLAAARLLVSRGADPRRATKKGVGCLHWAAWGGAVGVAEWLLTEVGLPLETLSDAGCNSAVWAAASGSVQCCAWFLRQGADFTRVNDWGHGVVNKAAWKGHAELLRWLLDEVPQVSPQCFLRDAAGFLPVQLAEQAGHTAVVALLRERMEGAPQPLRDAAPPRRVHRHKARELAGGLPAPLHSDPGSAPPAPTG